MSISITSQVGMNFLSTCGGMNFLSTSGGQVKNPFFFSFFFISRGNQHPLPPPLALDVEVLDKKLD